MITLEELSSAVSHTGENAIDTVVVGIVDMQGRLQGKRFHAQHFVDVVAPEGTEGWHYLLAVDVDMCTVDYSLLGTARVEPLLRRIRLAMAGAGLRPESAKGECNYGQHEIAFRYGEALTCADQHAIYKNGAKEIAAQEGLALTFMAKPNEREGNSCHIHSSLRSTDRKSTRLNSSHSQISYAVFCLKKKR